MPARRWNQKFDVKFDKKQPVVIQNNKLLNPSSKTLDDPQLCEYLEQNTQETDRKKTSVYTTDTFLLALMTLQHSEFPWYIWVHKEGKDIVLDKYEKESNNNSYLDHQTIDENSTQHNILKNYAQRVLKAQQEKSYDEEPIIIDLCQESTFIQNSLLNQSIDRNAGWQIGDTEHEVECGEELASKKAFRYVKAVIDDKIDIYTRVAIDSYIEDSNLDGERWEVRPIYAILENPSARTTTPRL